MKRRIITALLIAAAVPIVAGTEEGKKRGPVLVEYICSYISSNRGAFKELRGREVTVQGRLSSVSGKRTAYLENRLDTIVELVITPEPKKTHFGEEIPSLDCYASCLVNVPGEECENRGENNECVGMIDQKLEENKNTILKLGIGDSITVSGRLGGESLIPQYSIGGRTKEIVHFVLSKCEIPEKR